MKAVLASRILGALAALGALAFATPASAQSYDRGYERGERPYSGRSADTGFQIERIRMRLRDGVDSGVFDPWQARRLFAELREIDFVRAGYLRSRGMQDWEARDLDERIQRLRMHMRREFAAVRGGSGRYGDERFEERARRREPAPEVEATPPDDEDWRAEEPQERRSAPRVERAPEPNEDLEDGPSEYGPRYQHYERRDR